MSEFIVNWAIILSAAEFDVSKDLLAEDIVGRVIKKYFEPDSEPGERVRPRSLAKKLYAGLHPETPNPFQSFVPSRQVYLEMWTDLELDLVAKLKEHLGMQYGVPYEELLERRGAESSRR